MLNLKYIRRIIDEVKNLSKRVYEDSVYAVSGHATLFIIISFFPFIMLLLALVKYLPFSQNQIIELFDNISLGIMNETVRNIIKEVYETPSVVVLSITAITVLWSASKSVYSLQLGLNRIYNHKETRNYFLLRGLSLLYTAILLLSILVSLILMVFGRTILDFLATIFKGLIGFEFILNIARQSIAFFIILLIFDLFYTFVPNRPSRLIFELPGALISALGWYVFSFFYSIYIRNVGTFIYGSLTAVVLLMVWLYFCMYIFFIGAEINIVVEKYGWCKQLREKFLKKRQENG